MSSKQKVWDEQLDEVPWQRILALTRREWYFLAGGVAAAAVQGAIFPLFAVFFAKVLPSRYQVDNYTNGSLLF